MARSVALRVLVVASMFFVLLTGQFIASASWQPSAPRPIAANDDAGLPAGEPTVTSVSPNSLNIRGGARVVITGSGFNHVRAVLFGKAKGRHVEVKSSTKLVVEAPPNARGEVDVVVVTAAAASAPSAISRVAYGVPPVITSVLPRRVSSLGGSSLVIKGVDFGDVLGVAFGRNSPAASFVVKSSNEIEAVAPAHATGMVDVRVTTRFGTSSAWRPDRITFVAPPSVASIDPPTGDASGGTTVTVKGTGFSRTTSVAFGESNATSVVVISDTTLTVVSPPHSSSEVHLRVASDVGSSAPTSKDVFTYIAPGGLTGSISGTVLLPDGSAASGVRVEATRIDLDAAITTATTAPDGSYSMAGVEPGSYAICFTPPDSSLVPQCYPNATQAGSVPLSTVEVVADQDSSHIDAHLAAAGSLGGIVTTESDGSPVPDVSVQIESNEFSLATTTGQDGRYSAAGLPEGTYSVCFLPPPTDGAVRFIGQCYANQPLSSPAPNPVHISVGSALTDIDASLRQLGGIAGTVTAGSTNTGLGGVAVEAARVDGTGATSFATTAADGTYAVAGLESGDYQVCFYPGSESSFAFLPECFNGQPINGALAPMAVPVVDGLSSQQVDAHLSSAGSISGTVTSAGAPVAGVGVQIVPLTGFGSQIDVVTAVDGTYAAEGLADGDYAVCFYPAATPNGPLTQCYNAQPTSGNPNPVAVVAGSAVVGIDAALPRSATITGTIRGAGGPVAAAVVEATSLTDGATYYGTSDVDGTYTVSGLLGDSYSVCAYPTGGGVTGFLSRCYQDQPPGSALIDAVVVLDGATTNQTDIQLPVAAEIRGTVTDSGTGSPVAGVEVDAFPTGSRGAQMTVSTAADGTYSMAGLEDGDYLVCFFPDLGFAPQCYSNQPADGTGSPQPVPALAGASSTGIDAALTPGN